MKCEENQTNEENHKEIELHHGSSSNPVYGMGLIGAWVYYLKRATTTEERIKGILKGFAWPAFLVYELFTFLQKE